MTPAGIARLIDDEGCRLKVYDDRSGSIITRGPAGGNPTIGVGRSLAIDGITQAEADYLLNNDIARIEAKLRLQYSYFNALPPVWADVAVMVMFNTGETFPAMMVAMRTNNVTEAAAQLLNSKAAEELPTRYQRMHDAIIAGSWNV